MNYTLIHTKTVAALDFSNNCLSNLVIKGKFLHTSSCVPESTHKMEISVYVRISIIEHNAMLASKNSAIVILSTFLQWEISSVLANFYHC